MKTFLNLFSRGQIIHTLKDLIFLIGVFTLFYVSLTIMAEI